MHEAGCIIIHLILDASTLGRDLPVVSSEEAEDKLIIIMICITSYRHSNS